MIGSTAGTTSHSTHQGSNWQVSGYAATPDRTVTFNKHAWLDAVCESTVSSGAKLRAMALWRFANADGFCWPNQDQIEASVGHKSIKRTSSFMKELEAAGFIHRGYQAAGAGGKKSANYQMLMPTKVGINTGSPVPPEYAETATEWQQDLQSF